jgi:PAS domain S-box-containing protein
VNPGQRKTIIQKLQSEGKVNNIEVELYSEKTGDLRKVLFSASSIHIGGEPCLLSVLIDITAQEKEAEALKQSEEKYRMLVENSLQGLAIFQDSHFVFCNNAFAKMSGYSVHELLNLSTQEIFTMIPVEDRTIVLDRIYSRILGGVVNQRYEHRAIRKDGTEVWLELFSSPMEYNGKPAIQVVFMDITDRKRAEQALKESEEKLRLITEMIDEVFWMKEMKTEKLVYISPAHERIWGYPHEKIYQNPKAFYDHIHPDDRMSASENLALMWTGQPLDYEYRIVRPDGVVRQIWDRGFPVKDKSGRITHYVGVAQDVTSWRQAESALKESREYLNRIINCIGDPIFVKDRQHRYAMVNDAHCAFVGFRREEIIGKTLSEFKDRALPASIWEEEEKVFQTGQQCDSEETLTDARGKTRFVMTKKALLKASSGGDQIVGIIRDITEHKNLEAQFTQAQKMEAIGILAGGVAHDFNNLLSVIKGYTSLLIEDLGPDSQYCSDLKQIERAGEKATKLTAQLLAFGRKQMLRPEVIDLNAIVKESSKMLQRLIGEDIELNAVTPAGLGLIHADPGQIEQIIMNLAVNARDAMPDGGKLILETANVELDANYAQAHSIVAPGPYVSISISDTGTGMDEATKGRIFEPFFTTKGKGKGTGLGLCTVYGIVQQSSGHIWVYSEPGQGATFKIYFPRIEGKTSAPVYEAKLNPDCLGTETILIAEDEDAVRALAGRILRERGYTILDAPNGIEALRLAREHSGPIHLILTDVVMPGMSGKTLVNELESVRPGIKSLYMSGYTDNAIVSHGILDSNIAFLQKPFTLESLVHKVREVVDE